MKRLRPAPPAAPKRFDPFAPEPPPEEPDPGRAARRARRLLPVFLAATAVITVGAAAYSRSALSHESKASLARSIVPSEESRALRRELRSSDETERGRANDAAVERLRATGVATTGPVSPTSVPVSGSLVRDPAGNWPGVDVEIGRINVTRDATGIAQTSLPLRVTNLGYVPRSFDIKVTARDPLGAHITDDTGTVLDLRPGQSAEVRVLDIVNNQIAGELAQATFDVTDVFAY